MQNTCRVMQCLDVGVGNDGMISLRYEFAEPWPMSKATTPRGG